MAEGKPHQLAKRLMRAENAACEARIQLAMALNDTVFLENLKPMHRALLCTARDKIIEALELLRA